MKYWILYQREVRGPYTAAELTLLPGYSSEDLVCQEDLKGDLTTDWRLVRTVPELASSLGQEGELYAAIKTALTELWEAIAESLAKKKNLGTGVKAMDAPRALEAPLPPQPAPTPEVGRPQTDATVRMILGPQALPVSLPQVPAKPESSSRDGRIPPSGARPAPQKRTAILRAVLVSVALCEAWVAFYIIANPKVPSPAYAPTARSAGPASRSQVSFENLEIDSIDLVRAWPTGDPSGNVGRLLDEQAARSQRLSFWMVERLKDDVFKVTFTVGSVSKKAVVYEFQTRLSDKSVVGINAAAQAFLP